MTGPIRVLHVLQRMEAAGVQTLLMNIYRHIDREKVQFDFLVHYTAPQVFDSEIESLGGRIYRLSVREDYNVIKYIKQLKMFFIQHPEYKIVHGHMHSLGAVYLSVAEKSDVPVRIAHSHTNNTQNDAKKYFKLFMNKLYAKHATDLFACSMDAGKYMFGNKKFIVLNNAIDSEKFKFERQKRDNKRKELKLENKFVIGHAGRFTQQKNQKYCVDILEQVVKKRKETVLLFIGSGPMINEVKKYVEEKKLSENVRFLGNRNDMPELYMAMDVFIFPSLFEGLGIVGVEAQASGTPVICTKSLPKEIDVTPIIRRLELGNPVEWADMAIKQSMINEAHKDMHSYIEKAQYDIVGLSRWLQDYYLNF